MSKPRHPMQRVHRDTEGVLRFVPNAIVRHLLGTLDLDDLWRLSFDADDWSQFSQLIGYRVDGYADLKYAEHRRAAKAERRFLKRERKGE